MYMLKACVLVGLHVLSDMFLREKNFIIFSIERRPLFSFDSLIN